MSSLHTPKFWVIIPAAGAGARMQIDTPKQYLKIENKTLLEHTISCFLDHSAFDRVLVGLSGKDTYFEAYGLNLISGIETFEGGSQRADTVLKGLEFISNQVNADDWVWVHDAARPCLSRQEIDLLIQALKQNVSGIVLGVPITDTLKRVFQSESAASLPQIKETVDRDALWRAMTPQIFKYSELRKALEFCRDNSQFITDEASAVEKIGQQAFMLHGSEQNIKVTLPADLIKVRDYLVKKHNSQKKLNQQTNENQEELKLLKNTLAIPRIGTGFDVHAFGVGSFVTMGGVQIPYEKGLIAHSDGDVLLHAIMDAMLGALALGDIGTHFPDTDEKWKGANSRFLLKAVNALIKAKGFKVGNIDSTIIAQAPKMSAYIVEMQRNITADLEVGVDCIGVKATTTEKLGFTGRKEGIACQAAVILMPLSSGVSL
ncbi:MAG: 2-C-methyl-D-erythritol 4-phosphate cytidylyltransferase [Oleiphilaceae bacterium]|jgi:2-C-methyl-D-erythritol 2,4-cyclodiphosphate synthase/2-C-methyl-D-erythritol 4-phosphate cytidylyltransferase